MSLAETTLTKTQIVDAILEMNATASRDWLMSFDFAALRGYFLRLHHAFAPRGTAWEPRLSGSLPEATPESFPCTAA